jgi:hypothetical protein
MLPHKRSYVPKATGTILFSLFSILCFGQNAKELQFKKVIQDIVTAFSKLDEAGVSKYINKDIGIYQLDRIGVFDHYNHFDKVVFNNKNYPQILFNNSKGIQLMPLQYAVLPQWSCEMERWNKTGLFTDTIHTDHLLSNICQTRNKDIPDNIPAKTIQSFRALEKQSRRIVLCDKNQAELVFYLSYIKGKWQLTIVDYVTSDCSA